MPSSPTLRSRGQDVQSGWFNDHIFQIGPATNAGEVALSEETSNVWVIRNMMPSSYCIMRIFAGDIITKLVPFMNKYFELKTRGLPPELEILARFCCAW